MSDEVNVNKLRKQLGEAVEADEAYWRENDAKFRAVRQKVSSYEEFRDIVKAAHLQPLEKKDLTRVTNDHQPWNPHTTTDGNRAQHDQSTTFTLPNKPRNCQEFLREWRTLNANVAGKNSLLMDTGAELLGKFFSVEISMGLLGEMITVLNKEWSDEHASLVSSILECLANSQRFSLSLKFLTQQERKEVEQLVHKLSHQGCSDKAFNLAQLYGVNIS